MSTSKQHAEDGEPSKGSVRKQELALVAYRLLAERGFEGLRVREVAATAGINIATLHYYFPSKEDLIHAVGEHLFQQFLTVTAPLPEGYQDTPDQQILQVFRDMQYQLAQVPDLFIVMNELHLHALRDPAVHALLQKLNDQWQAHLAWICTAGMQQGLFRSDIDAQDFARAIIALLKGISLQAASHLDGPDLEALGTRIVDWLKNE